jgi:hypothetical protein
VKAFTGEGSAPLRSSAEGWLAIAGQWSGTPFVVAVLLTLVLTAGCCAGDYGPLRRQSSSPSSLLSLLWRCLFGVAG